MKTSEDIQEICKALISFHSEVGRIEKDGTNPYMENRYATIDQIIETIRPILARHDLFIMQLPSNAESGEIKMTTRIYHTSGQWMESPVLTIKPQKQDAQGIGSAVTYARRYSLTSFLSLNTGDDDDGNAASNRSDGNRQPQTREQGGRQREQSGNVFQMKNPNDPLTEPQRKKIFAILRGKKITDEQITQLVQKHAGKSGVSELTKKEATHFIELVQPMPPKELLETIREEAKANG
ncbi:ERF family protein [Kroppenstedtia sanguinis]|uniref:ERF family protein n=1 Tax=Kroppenstedtia sanguinis TaxID=1380684 RepID=A0ABW4C7K2_9BACL